MKTRLNFIIFNFKGWVYDTIKVRLDHIKLFKYCFKPSTKSTMLFIDDLNIFLDKYWTDIFGD